MWRETYLLTSAAATDWEWVRAWAWGDAVVVLAVLLLCTEECVLLALADNREA